MELKNKIKRKKLLLLSCIFGSIFYIFPITIFVLYFFIDLPTYINFINLLAGLILAYGSILIYNDAIRIKAGKNSIKEELFNTETWYPITWASITFLLYPFCSFFYLFKREKIFKLNSN